MLAGTSTLATLMGAQSLAMLDSQPVDEEFTEDVVVELTFLPTVATFPTTEAIPTDIAQIAEPTEETILHVEPSITIFRQAGSANTDVAENNVTTTNPTIDIASNATSNNVVIQPPSPIELVAPEPIVIVEEPVIVQPPVQVQQQPQAQPQPQAQQQQQQEQPKKEKKPKKSRSGSSK